MEIYVYIEKEMELDVQSIQFIMEYGLSFSSGAAFQ